ncbi:MAG: hypothetical protein AAF420_01810, partial [Pseudomonadota bacterium]
VTSLALTMNGDGIQASSGGRVETHVIAQYEFRLGSGNVVKAVLFRQLAIAKESFVGIMAATSILVNVAKLTAYVQNGLLNTSQIPVYFWLIGAAISTALLGKYLLKRVSLQLFERGVLVILGLAALNLLLTSGN